MPNNNPELTLGEKAVKAGLQLYDKFADRKTMPTNRRIFLESVLDKSKEPITEASFSPEELGTLTEVIFNKYKPLGPALEKYEKFLAERINQHTKAVAAKNKDQIMYPEFVQGYSKDLAAIRAYKEGKLTPDFLNLASGQSNYVRSNALGRLGIENKFNIKPAVAYEDYGIDPEQARSALAGADPRSALHTTLGRFQYSVDPTTNALVIVDRYDFNPYRSVFTNKPVAQQTVSVDDVAVSPEGGGSGIYKLLRSYAGRVLPEGSGRDVQVRLNNLAPLAPNALVNR
jgi:hypothetical protein